MHRVLHLRSRMNVRRMRMQQRHAMAEQRQEKKARKQQHTVRTLPDLPKRHRLNDRLIYQGLSHVYELMDPHSPKGNRLCL